MLRVLIFILFVNLGNASANINCDMVFLGKSFGLDSFEVEKAYKFAKLAHKGQVRRLEGKPYLVHPDRVARSVLDYRQDQDLVIAALLHDVIEDSNFTYNNIERLFGKRVANLVLELSSDPQKLEQMGKTAYLSHKLNTISDDALFIKLLDRKDNLGDLALGDQKFVQKYTKSTMAIIRFLKGRKLTLAHKTIIREILNLL